MPGARSRSACARTTRSSTPLRGTDAQAAASGRRRRVPAAMLINPNNHALDGGPATAEMEKEVVARLAAMFGLPDDALGHLTACGTIANLEALWVARELHPGKAVAYSRRGALHARAHVRRARGARAASSGGRARPDGRRRAGARSSRRAASDRRRDAGHDRARRGRPGRRGDRRCASARRAGARRRRVRRVLQAARAGRRRRCRAGLPRDRRRRLGRRRPAQARAAAVRLRCVLFRDPGVGRLYRHDSPYTYFTSDELHLGEIRLECSRAVPRRRRCG